MLNIEHQKIKLHYNLYSFLFVILLFYFCITQQKIILSEWVVPRDDKINSYICPYLKQLLHGVC